MKMTREQLITWYRKAAEPKPRYASPAISHSDIEAHTKAFIESGGTVERDTREMCGRMVTTARGIDGLVAA